MVTRDGLAGAWMRAAPAVLALALLGACSTSRPEAAGAPSDAPEPLDGFHATRSAGCGFSASMPAPIRERGAREGAAQARIVWAIDEDGTRYEVACFDRREPLDEASRAALLVQIERGLTEGPGTLRTQKRQLLVNGVPSTELIVDFDDDRTGQWWILRQGEERLLQVSVLGPSGDRRTRGAAVFFRSFRLLQRAPDGAR